LPEALEQSRDVDLTPARKANSRWRGSPGTMGSIGWLSGRMAQAPAMSFEVMMMEDTPSPARAGRCESSSFSSSVGIASTQVCPELKRPGKSCSRKNVLVST